MHKPPRRMHTSTGRFPFSRRSPSKRRAFLGVFNITKGFGRRDKCQRAQISLQIKRCQPITPPIIRRKHQEIPIFARGRYAGAFDCRILAKMHVATTPHMARTKTNAQPKRPRTIFVQIDHCPYGSARVTQARGRPSFPAHSTGRKNPRRTYELRPNSWTG